MRRIVHIIVYLAAAAAALFPAVSGAQVTPPPPGQLIAPLVLKTTTNNVQCLQPANKSMAAGAAIVRVNCAAAAEQLWFMTGVGNGYFHLVNALTSLCLDARGSATSGTPVQQWPCNGISNETWELKGPAFIVSYTSKVSGTSKYCLDVNTPGPSAQIYPCNATASQLWNIASQFIVTPQVTGLASGKASNMAYIYGFIPVLVPPPANSNGCTAKNKGIVLNQSVLAGTTQNAKNATGKKPGLQLTVCPPF